jgi:hypothetical protein
MTKLAPMSGRDAPERATSRTPWVGGWRSGVGRWALAVLLGCVALLAAAPVAAAESTGISGTVTNAKAEPVEGIQVQVVKAATHEFAGFASTNAKGEYTATVAPGSYNVEFRDFTNKYAAQFYNEQSSFSEATPVSVVTEKITPTINAKLREGGKISGTVRDTHGNPLQNIQVFASHEEFFAEPVLTDAEGKYTLTGLPKGSYKVQFFPAFGQNFVPQYYNEKPSFAEADPVLVVEEETKQNINATLQEGGKISGTVTDAATHKGLPFVSITASRTAGFEFFGGFAVTNANGEYIIVGLASGLYNLEFEQFSETGSGSEYITQTQNGIGVKQGSTTSGINVALIPLRPNNTGSPVASGTPSVGQKLSCSSGTWTGIPTLTYAYRWLRDGSAIAGASGSTYVVQSADQGHGLACEVTATNSVGHAAATSNALRVPAVSVLAFHASAPPTVANAAQSNSTWSEGNKRATFSRKKKPPIGTTFSFTLNEQASVSFAFTQQLGGRKVKGRCVAQTKANRHKPACKRTVTQGTLSFTGHAGKNKVSFQGRVSASKKLPLGRYTLVITATTATGQRSQPKSLSFTIVK